MSFAASKFIAIYRRDGSKMICQVRGDVIDNDHVMAAVMIVVKMSGMILMVVMTLATWLGNRAQGDDNDLVNLAKTVEGIADLLTKTHTLFSAVITVGSADDEHVCEALVGSALKVLDDTDEDVRKLAATKTVTYMVSEARSIMKSRVLGTLVGHGVG